MYEFKDGIKYRHKEKAEKSTRKNCFIHEALNKGTCTNVHGWSAHCKEVQHK